MARRRRRDPDFLGRGFRYGDLCFQIYGRGAVVDKSCFLGNRRDRRVRVGGEETFLEINRISPKISASS